MELLNEIDKKVQIDYPCEWKYKIIGKEKEKIKRAVEEVMGERPHSFRYSRASQKGKYHSYEVKTIVHNEEERTELFTRLKRHHDLTMVL